MKLKIEDCKRGYGRLDRSRMISVRTSNESRKFIDEHKISSTALFNLALDNLIENSKEEENI